MNCPICQTRLMPQDIIAHLVEVEGIVPDHAPQHGDPVWSRCAGLRLSVRTARQNYQCQGCREPIRKGQLHAGMLRSPLHFCLTRCAGFGPGIEIARPTGGHVARAGRAAGNRLTPNPAGGSG